MRKKTLKAMALVALAGTVFQFGGCLNIANFRGLLPGILAVQFSNAIDAAGFGLGGIVAGATTTTTTP
ncbi:MAG: hypothetical protein ACE5E6_05690 [Phycisphaerae bacterium]